MRFFSRQKPEDFSVSSRLLQMVSAVSEYKGKQALFANQNPEQLDVLRQAAIVQSTESSSRIEQVTAAPARLVLLMEEKTTPKNRSEQEIVGYRNVLNLIHSNKTNIPVRAATILQFHRDLFWYTNAGGKYKFSSNEIVRTDANGVSEVIFVPVPAHMVPMEMQTLDEEFQRLTASGDYDPLMLAASYVFDFLCIHPFKDGNGRISRLITNLLLYHAGHEVPGYISLEKVVEETKESYYDALNRSSQGWHDNTHDLLPWIEYFIGVVLLKAYRRFESNVTFLQKGSASKSDAVVTAIKYLPEQFKVSDIKRACPHVSQSTIRDVLKKLKNERKVKCIRKGADAMWEKTKASKRFWAPEDEQETDEGQLLFWGSTDGRPFWQNRAMHPGRLRKKVTQEDQEPKEEQGPETE